MTHKAFKTQYGKQLRERRTALKLTQRQIAAAVQVSEATVSRWEAGLTAPPGLYRSKILRRYFETREVAGGSG